MRLISELRRADRALIGAKATTLGELHDRGLRIPPGFVIPDEVFRTEIESEGDRLGALVATACRRLDPQGESNLAVRSCAQFEDGVNQSLAGRFETFLNVTPDRVAESARLVWRGCDTQSGGRSSVIVQQMVTASQAGVIFTVNPVTGNPAESVIEVVDGLGDRLVGGLVTPTKYVIAAADGSTHERLGPGQARLPSAQVAELMDIGRIANRALGVACELEWAIANEQVFVLQCRPITGLPTVAQSLAPGDSPADSPAGSSRHRQQYESRNARPWYSVTSIGVFGRSLDELTGFGYRDIISVTDSAMRTRGFHDVAELAQATEHFADYWRDADQVAEFLARCDSGFARAQRLLDCQRVEDLSTWTSARLLEEIRWAEELFAKLFQTMVVTQPQHVEPLEVALRELVADDAEPEAAMVAATRCSRPLPNDSEEHDLEQLRERVRVGLDTQSLDEELDRLARCYGWIAVVESGEPYGREHYRTRLLHEPPHRTPMSTVALSPEALRIGCLVGDLGNYRLWNRHYFMAVRHYLQQIIDVLVERSGAPFLAYATTAELFDWHATGHVDQVTIAARRSGYTGVLIDGVTAIITGDQAAALAHLAEGSAGAEIAALTDRGVVAGDCACPGRVTGRVRVVSFVTDDYDDEVANFCAGEILVTGMTRPQISHLCDRAAGIVTDEGGITCHAAVIGREWGIPTLVATHDATKVLRTGDLVHLDAQAGRLTILDSGPSRPPHEGSTR